MRSLVNRTWKMTKPQECKDDRVTRWPHQLNKGINVSATLPETEIITYLQRDAVLYKQFLGE